VGRLLRLVAPSLRGLTLSCQSHAQSRRHLIAHRRPRSVEMATPRQVMKHGRAAIGVLGPQGSSRSAWERNHLQQPRAGVLSASTIHARRGLASAAAWTLIAERLHPATGRSPKRPPPAFAKVFALPDPVESLALPHATFTRYPRPSRAGACVERCWPPRRSPDTASPSITRQAGLVQEAEPSSPDPERRRSL